MHKPGQKTVVHPILPLSHVLERAVIVLHNVHARVHSISPIVATISCGEEVPILVGHVVVETVCS